MDSQVLVPPPDQALMSSSLGWCLAAGNVLSAAISNLGLRGVSHPGWASMHGPHVAKG